MRHAMMGTMDRGETAFREQPPSPAVNPASGRGHDESLLTPPGETAASARRVGHSVSDGKPTNGERRIRKVLVATDFSPSSVKAVEHAAALANQCDATLTILHVIDINAQATPGKSGVAAELMKDPWAGGFAKMGQMAWSLCGRVDAQTAMQEGLPWEEIVNKSREVDVLVLGRSRARAGGKLFSEHTVQRVIENSACPVLVVRDQG
jgi:nucleotide-binding universal stress UspA family protein